MKNHIILFFLLFIPALVVSQEYASKEYYLIDSLDLTTLSESDIILLDSCLQNFHNAKHDTTRVIAIDIIVDEMYSEAWKKYNQYLFELADSCVKLKHDVVSQKKIKSILADAVSNIGYNYNTNGDSDNGILYYKKALGIYKSINDTIGILLEYGNIGHIMSFKGQVDSAMYYRNLHLKIATQLNDPDLLAYSYNSLGFGLLNQKYYDEALVKFQTSLNYSLQINDSEGIGIANNNIGFCHQSLNQDSLAIIHYKKSISTRLSLGQKSSVVSPIINLVSIYKTQIDSLISSGKEVPLSLKDTTLNLLNQALSFAKVSGKSSSLATIYSSLSHFQMQFSNYTDSRLYADSAYYFAKKNGYLTDIIDATKSRFAILKQVGEYKIAIDMLEELHEAQEKRSNKEHADNIIQQNYKLQYEIKTSTDSVLRVEEMKVKNVEIEKQELEVKSQKKQKWYLYIGLGLVALFGMFMFNRFKVTQKQKNIIDKQKHLVEQQKSAVESQKSQLEQQHLHLEEIHKEISDSIKYAERLQLAILPPKEDMKKNLGDGFVLFQPKDVVSGDFYWMQKVNNTTLFAAADCTGHGVPGAMVSVVCSNALNRSVKEFGLIEPKDILEKTRELVIETFARSGKDVKDGMDIALCSLKDNRLVYAGANNPLWIVRKTEFLSDTQKEERSSEVGDNFSLIEYRANKQPIGLYAGMKDFEQHEVHIYEGDSLYIFTDGFADQFGGEKGKKFKYKPFKKFLIEINDLNMNDQRDAINDTFHSWKGDIEQVDDVCIIGVKL